MDKPITYVGLDVHKDTIAIALAEAGKRGEVREYGKIANTSAALQALATKLARGGQDLRFCYEAGPCGYGIQRQLSTAGHECVVGNCSTRLQHRLTAEYGANGMIGVGFATRRGTDDGADIGEQFGAPL